MNSILMIVASCLVVGITGLIIGVILGVSQGIFKVETSEKEIKVREALPGNNCGGCGFAGCDALAKAIAAGECEVNACPVGGDKVAKKIAKIMGATLSESTRMVANVKCKGDCKASPKKFDYYGSKDCNEVSFSIGGDKSCDYGCLGYGSCLKVCEFDAISIKNSLAVIDKDKCKACKKCIDACPRKLIELIPYAAETKVLCNNKDMGKEAVSVCKNSCIACRMCEKNCPVEAISIKDNVAVIDYDKCISCGKCKEVCKRNAIVS
ncbi:electron transport complex, RnfABCDGE type, B subunit [Lachnospiraceae bacterium RM5]|nr:electron transport complex, RnfABCDGE type, B subunit [Lachnospiraceae bacterium RM5]